MNQPTPHGWLSTAQAAARLGVKPDTLYAYVSRGLLRSVRGTGGRGSLFDPSEVAGLAQRPRRRQAVPEILFRSTVAVNDAAALVPDTDPPAADVRIAKRVTAGLPPGATAFDRLRVIAFALAASEEDRSPAEAARRLVAVLVAILLPGREAELRAALAGSMDDVRCAIAARLSAAAGADIYAVVASAAHATQTDPVRLVAQAVCAMAHALDECAHPSPIRVRIAFAAPPPRRERTSSLGAVMEYLKDS